MALRHSYTATGTNDPTKQVSVDRWNADHSFDSEGVLLPINATSPTSPPADNLVMFAKKVAGRVLPASEGPSGLYTTLQPSIGRNGIQTFKPTGTTGLGGLGLTLTATGTATIPNGAGAMAATNMHLAMNRLGFLVTTASTTAVAGFRLAQATVFRGNTADKGGFYAVFRWGPATGVTTATRRAFVGLGSTTTAPTDVNPSTQLNIIGVGYDSADTNLQIMHNDGTGTATKVDTGIARASADYTGAYELVLFCAPNTATVGAQVMDIATGTTFTTTLSTDLPASTTFLCIRGYTSVGGTSSVTGLSLMGVYVEQDN